MKLGLQQGTEQAELLHGGPPHYSGKMPKQNAVSVTCAECGAPARVHLSNRPLCDRCSDRAIARHTGWPELPDPPAAEEWSGPDGRKHGIQYRLWRSPGGVVAEAEEIGRSGKLKLEGYHFKLVGEHTTDSTELVQALRTRVRREIGRQYLKRMRAGGEWLMVGNELHGRLVWSGANEQPYDVVVDGRRLTWDELGRALQSYEGWEFRLVIEESKAQ